MDPIIERSIASDLQKAILPQTDKPSLGKGGAPIRIALLTPYSGNNLGDAAIQDAIIAHLRARLPGVQFSGISLNDENFVERHGTDAFPLYRTTRIYHGMPQGKAGTQPTRRESVGGKSERGAKIATVMKRALKRIPVLGRSLKRLRAWVRTVRDEIRHWVGGYGFLRSHDLLIVSGGGQLDEEWGGPWGHPFALLKWGVLARLARVPCAMASVGACKINSKTCRLFLSAALRMAGYRSYREGNSRKIASRLWSRALRDPVVPDLAFSLPGSELPLPAGIRTIAQGRTIVAISPIAFAKPQTWPTPDAELYNRYIQQMARVVRQLLEREYFVLMVWSAITDRGNAVQDLLELIDPEFKKRHAGQISIPTIRAWKDLVALLLDVDFVIASRLHSIILAVVAQKPTIAISFDPKVDWVMEDIGQTGYLLQIRDFSAEGVIHILGRLEARRSSVTAEIGSYRQRILIPSFLQYDTLAELATACLKGLDPTNATGVAGGCSCGSWHQ